MLIARGWSPPPPDERIVDELMASMETFGVKQASTHGLTAQEIRVMELVAIGRSNVEVAEALGLAPHTVKFHLTKVYKKLGAKSRTEAAAMFISDPKER